jgi:iron complex transport system substrate-binding protein
VSAALRAVLAVLAAASLAAQAPVRRIVSLVPAVTEMLFAIGAGPRVVGVSSYDREPAEVAALPRVGALLDPDLERILSLTPDLVVVYGSQTDLQEQLARAKIAAFSYRHGGLRDVTDMIRRLGDRLAVRVEADRVATGIEQQIEAVRRSVAGRARPRVMVVFGREPGALRNVYASGGVGFLHDVLEAAGGTNVFADVPRESVQASVETILARAPDVILELQATGGAQGAQADTKGAAADARAVWQPLASVPAVRNGRVIVLEGTDLIVPGPRVGRAAARIAAALHPGV